MKLFLVEDEVMALRALQRKITDLGMECEIVGTAMNGVQALKAIEQANPDVVITDIRMPDMDGITLVSRLRESFPAIIPVITTGYQEFEYAKQAITLGVKDYLLKPVEPSELARCLESCRQEMKKRTQRNAISFLIGNEQVSLKDAHANESYTVVYFIVANALSNFENILHPNQPYISAADFGAKLKKFCPDTQQLSCFDGFFSNEKVVVLRGASLSESAQIHWLERAAKEIEQYSRDFVTVFFKSARSSGQLSSLIRSTRKGAVQNMILGLTSVSCHRVPLPAPDPKLQEYAELFAMLLHQNQPGLLRSNLHRIFAAWRNPPRPAVAVQNDMIYLLDSLKHHFSADKSFPFSSAYLVENLVCFSDNWENFSDNFFQLLTELFDFSHASAKSMPPQQLVQQIEEYFRQNISSNITLQMLSDEMGMSKVYLCRVFKRYKDMTPIDYFTRMRIDRAQKLMQQFPDMPLREISGKLGFSDMYYFSKVFKKITGHSPSEGRV